MEGEPKPRFRRAEREGSEYPVLERVRDEASEVRELNPEEQEDLRETIRAVREKDREEEVHGGSASIMSRRRFMLGATASTAAVVTGAELLRRNMPEEAEVTESEVNHEPEEAVEEIESVEYIPQSESFEGEVEGHKVAFTLDRDFVQFVDENNNLVGEPVKLESFVGPLPEGVTVKEGQKPEYNYVITDDEFSLPEMTTRWRRIKQRKVENEKGEKIHKTRHPVTALRAAARETDEPELVNGVLEGDVRSVYGINDYFINKPIDGFDGNRVEYLQQNLKFREELETVKGVPGVEFVPVPTIVQEELRFLIPGLVAQESNFNEGLVNKRSGALGPGQFMPDTWKRYTGEEKVSSDFVRQVEVIGPCISDMYDRVLDKVGDDALDKLRSVFPNEEEFLKDLIVPLTIGAYNAGPDRLAEAAKLYTESVQVDDMVAGKDLFIAIVDFAEASEGGKYLSGYGEEARAYVSSVYAKATVLRGEGDVEAGFDG